MESLVEFFSFFILPHFLRPVVSHFPLVLGGSLMTTQAWFFCPPMKGENNGQQQ